MANFTINIPDDKVTALVDAFAKQYNYQEQVSSIDEETGEEIMVDNPLAKPQFAKNIINSYIKEVYVAAQVKEIEVTKQTLIQESSEDISGVSVE